MTGGRAPVGPCQFNEHINCLTSGGAPERRGVLIRSQFRKKKSCSIPNAEALDYGPAKACSRKIQACRTEAWERRLIAPSTGHTWGICQGPSLDQRGSDVYSSLIRTGHSPPAQLSTLNLVVARKGFLCLQCKESGDLVER